MAISSTAIGGHADYFAPHQQAEPNQVRQEPETQLAAVELAPPASSAEAIADLLSRVTASDVSQFGALWINGGRGATLQTQGPATE